MKSKLIFPILVFMGLVILFRFEWPISIQNISGIYTNNNYEEEPFYAEVPYNKDTLILYENETFSSNYYNTGIYEINSGVLYNYLSLYYEYNMTIPESILKHAEPENKEIQKDKSGKAKVKFRVRNTLLESTKIMIVEDLKYYYSKI